MIIAIFKKTSCLKYQTNKIIIMHPSKINKNLLLFILVVAITYYPSNVV